MEQAAEKPLRIVSNDSEAVGSVPKNSEGFGTVRNDAEAFGNVPKAAERKANHTLTVREVARLFEAAGVARTERSIINWCQPGRLGVPRLDAYFDPNEHRYFITPESVERAIAEEKAKATKTATEVGGLHPALPGGQERKVGEPPREHDILPKENLIEVKALQQEVFDLKITNRAKDYFIEQLKSERQEFISKLMVSERRVGELETKLLQLSGPAEMANGGEASPQIPSFGGPGTIRNGHQGDQ